MKNKKLKTMVWVAGVLLLLVCYDSFYKSLQEKKEEQQQGMELRIKTLKKYKTVIAQKDEIEKAVIANKDREYQIKAVTVEAKTSSLAAADIQKIIQPIITSAGGSIMRMNVKPSENKPPFQVINIELDTNLPSIAVLNDVIYDIETKKPIFFIKKMDARAINFLNPVEIMVSMEIYAIMKQM
ncbi:MAG: type II secretion system protein GspM [Candidatus Magnetominusculus sp. LBB02]|nr:type II secretion system protein GspM [Candidatus Magnetominusculus sp. LBB02]